MPISRSRATSCARLELRPLPSAGITRPRRYYGPLRHPRRPRLTLAGCKFGDTHPDRWGFPCCTWSPCARMPSPLPRRDRWMLRSSRPAATAFPGFPAGRLPHWSFRGLLSVHSRYGLRARRVAQGDPLHRRLRLLRYLHNRSVGYGPERQFARRDSHPLKTSAFPRHTRIWVPLRPRSAGRAPAGQPEGAVAPSAAFASCHGACTPGRYQGL